MNLIWPTTEAEMITVYLKGEITSRRWGQLIVDRLRQDQQSRSIVDSPDITNLAENVYRRRLLASYRGYVFEELPAHTTWYRAGLNREEVARVKYIDYDYWNELSNQTRLPCVAAETIRAGRQVFRVSNQGFLDLVQALREGACFSELIVVGASPASELTVFEGHVRLTAYMLAPEFLPDELEVIAGFAPECARV
jgi:hypothetical protein